MRRTQVIRWLSLLLAVLLLAGCSPTNTGAAAAPAGNHASGRDAFSVTLLSTGKSDCAVIYMDGLVIVNDTADEDDYDAIASKLRSDGVTKIDYLILSHYDKDHIGSAPSLIRNFEVGLILRTDQAEDSEAYDALVAAEKERRVPVCVLEKDYWIETANGQIKVDPPDMDYGDDNNNSAVTCVTYQGHRLLFLGDAKKKRLEELLPLLEGSVDFIKLPHHGDSNKALEALMRQACPRWAAETLSSEDDVAPKLVELLQALNVQLYSTADGPVRITWNGETLDAVQTAA